MAETEIRTFVCENCKRVIESDWTDDEAAAEAEQNFGPVVPEDMAVVCDDCYREFMAWWEKL